MESTIACSLYFLNSKKSSCIFAILFLGLDKSEEISEQIIKHTLINVIKGSSYEQYF
jgi:hypothetical protein